MAKTQDTLKRMTKSQQLYTFLLLNSWAFLKFSVHRVKNSFPGSYLKLLLIFIRAYIICVVNTFDITYRVKSDKKSSAYNDVIK